MQTGNKMDKVKIISNTQGVCPYCNSQQITYDSADFDGDLVSYPATCQSCGRYFEEWYHLKFISHNVGCYGQYDADEYFNKEIDYEKGI